MCLSRKPPRKMIHRPVMRMTPLDGPVEMTSLDFLGPLPTTSSVNEHIAFVTDPCSRRASTYPVSAPAFPALGASSILMNVLIAKQVSPKSLLMDRGCQFCCEPSRAVREAMGIGTLTRSS